MVLNSDERDVVMGVFGTIVVGDVVLPGEQWESESANTSACKLTFS